MQRALSEPERAEILTLEGIRTDREVADEFGCTAAEVRAIWNSTTTDYDPLADWDSYTEDYN